MLGVVNLLEKASGEAAYTFSKIRNKFSHLFHSRPKPGLLGESVLWVFVACPFPAVRVLAEWVRKED